MKSMETLVLSSRWKSFIGFIVLLLVSLGAVVIASFAQRDFGRVEVSDVWYRNFNGIMLRAKLFRPVIADETKKLPGVVHIHGYQNNRETGDAYCIETARRGFVVLNIDAIGRGHSGIPGDPALPDFDHTYGGKSSIDYLRNLPFVNRDSIGIMGHSLGAEMAYKAALSDPSIKALVITGFAYTLEASRSVPKNMLMIIGQYDEFRKRMTGTRNIRKEWMNTARTKNVFPVDNPELERTYGSHADGTARRVYVPPIIHIHESHHAGSIAEAVLWLKASLNPLESQWVDENSQIWKIKEWMTLVAMLSALAMLLPLGLFLLSFSPFRGLLNDGSARFECGGREYLKHVSINGLLLWLYLPLILVLFGIHKYAVRIDTVFPMMMVNAKVWWFLCVNLVGMMLIRRWYRRKAAAGELSIGDLGISFSGDRMRMDAASMVKTAVLGMVLFLVIYAAELFSEKLFIVNYRFLFPFMGTLTAYRTGMFFLYLPFILFCFIVTGVFWHAQLRRPAGKSFAGTFLSWSLSNALALVGPLVLFIMVQYVPLFTTGFIPFEGPNGLFVVFIINLIQIIILLGLYAFISTWFYILTGKVYLGALVNSLIMAWIFASSQVIAPVPV